MEYTKYGRKSIKNSCTLDVKLQFAMYAWCLALLKHQVIVRRIIFLQNVRSVMVITVNKKSSGSLPLSQPSGQSSLSSFFKVKTKSAVLHVQTDTRKDESWHHHASSPSSSLTEECALTFTSEPLSGKKSRKLSVVTANHWVITNLAAHMAQ